LAVSSAFDVDEHEVVVWWVFDVRNRLGAFEFDGGEVFFGGEAS
jgi:hypothetical protein